MAAAWKGLSNPHRIGLTDRLRNRFLNAVFRSKRRVKVPSNASQVLPESNVELETLIKRWAESRLELRRFVQNVPSRQANLGLFQHPVGGWMGMPEIFAFFSVHMVHHSYQLATLRDAYRDSSFQER